jgi:hypothetical protein
MQYFIVMIIYNSIGEFKCAGMRMFH